MLLLSSFWFYFSYMQSYSFFLYLKMISARAKRRTISSTLRGPNNVDDDFFSFCHKWWSLFVCFSPKTNLKKGLLPNLFILYTACNRSLGMESGKILDKQITASSEWSAHHAAHQGRLNFQEVVEGGVLKKSGSWSALISDQNQWLQVDLLRQEIITSVATQGRNKHPLWKKNNQWVKSYKLQYSNNGANLEYYKDERQNSAKVRLKMVSIYRKRRSQATSNYNYMQIGQKVKISLWYRVGLIALLTDWLMGWFVAWSWFKVKSTQLTKSVRTR